MLPSNHVALFAYLPVADSVKECLVKNCSVRRARGAQERSRHASMAVKAANVSPQAHDFFA